MTTDELRRIFLEFFEKRGHRICPSASLVPPPEDKSLLFVGAGMNAFKNEFLGRVPLKFKRAASSQKCMRTGDIGNVGRTDVHHTFFEMLGNFSFNDYFKRESIEWAWEFIVDVMKLPKDRLAVTVHKDDEEAFRIWEEIFPVEKIRILGDSKNFWPADAPKKGPNGLCGPCSEIFFDRGEELTCGHPWCGVECDCKNYRYVEIWNLVFQQYDRKEGGKLDPLPYKNIDTGMGLERSAAIMQGVLNDFDIDIFVPIVDEICRAVETDYGKDAESTGRIRRIADHARAVIFCIADGILPSNQGRGYVERKLIRQAALDGVKLGADRPFLYSLVGAVSSVMGEAYPEVKERRESISRILRAEEERFHQTLRQGSGILEEMIERLRESGGNVLAGDDAFRLFDTFGFPLDVAESILEDERMTIDRDGFEREMARQRELARAGTNISSDIFGSGPLAELKEKGVSTEFVGYERDENEARVLAIVDGGDMMEMADEGERVSLILDRTSFYAESGGEIADTGVIEFEGGFAEIDDCQWSDDIVVHSAVVRKGRIADGDRVACRPDMERRARIRRNHTATHLLHFALRSVLGEHAMQAGSLVAPDRLRFDFTHSEALTVEQIRRIEDIVMEKILDNAPVDARIAHLEEARKEGVTALFGEKYEDEVRVVSAGDFSRELCGGLHARATGDIGLMKIISENSVAAGVRRIEALTGQEAFDYLRDRGERLVGVARQLKTPVDKIEERINAMAEQMRALRAEAKKRSEPRQGASAKDLLDGAKKVGDARIIAHELSDGDAGQLRQLAENLTRNNQGVAALLATKGEKGVQAIVALSKDLVERKLDAVEIARVIGGEIGGGGGGRPDMAQAGGQNADKIASGLEKAVQFVESKLG